MAKAKERTGLRLSVAGTKLEMSVLFKSEGGRSGNLAKTTAGTSGFSFKRYCREHRAPVKSPLTCEAGGEVLTKEGLVHAYDMGGGNMAFLTNEQRDALKPKGDDTIDLLYLLDADEYGWGFAPELARLTGNAHAIIPNTTTSSAQANAKLWAGLLALLQGKVAVARVMNAGSFYHAILSPCASGAIIVHQLYLPEDCYEVPLVDVPALDEATNTRFQAKGDELTRVFDVESVATDPYRDARGEAIAAAARGEAPPPSAHASVKAPKEVDLIALL